MKKFIIQICEIQLKLFLEESLPYREIYSICWGWGKKAKCQQAELLLQKSRKINIHPSVIILKQYA